MKRVCRLLTVVLVLLPSGARDRAKAQSAELVPAAIAQQPSTDEFVPMNELPPEEQLPAAPLLIAAYVVVWLGLFAYVYTVWRRLQKIEVELSRVESRLTGREGTR
jgi:CcmD family protein